MIEQVRKHTQERFDNGIIRPSHSPFSSNIVLVKKHDGSLRLSRLSPTELQNHKGQLRSPTYR